MWHVEEEKKWKKASAQMGEKPVLTAVALSQFQKWSKAIIVAIPAKLRWKP